MCSSAAFEVVCSHVELTVKNETNVDLVIAWDVKIILNPLCKKVTNVIEELNMLIFQE